MPVIPKPRRTSYKNCPSGTHFSITSTTHFLLLSRHSDSPLPPVPRRGVGAAVSKKQKEKQDKIGGRWGSHGERKLKLRETRNGCGLKENGNRGRWEQRHAKLEKDTKKNGNWKWWVLIVHGFNRWVCHLSDGIVVCFVRGGVEESDFQQTFLFHSNFSNLFFFHFPRNLSCCHHSFVWTL